MGVNKVAAKQIKPVAETIRGRIPGALKARQSVTADWDFTQDLIHGVLVKEINNVPKDNGVLTEVFRLDWALDGGRIEQVFQVTLKPGAISAWHVHDTTTDRLFVADGLMKIVLYDARDDAPTYGRINEFRLGALRPGLLVVPPGVWHGVQNIGPGGGRLLNLVDCAYRYADPDHWKLPPDSDRIPYSFDATRSV